MSSDPRAAAREWFIALLAEPTAEQTAEFERWLRADPAHFEAYRTVEMIWHEVEGPGQRLAAQEAAEISGYLEAMDKAKRGKRKAHRLTVITILLATLVPAAIWLERPGLVASLYADHVTGRGERRSISLVDGSSVLLDADSAISEDFKSGKRRVRLIRGGAFFDVTPSAIPFVVEAAVGEVEVLGTAFEVRLLDDGGSVTLEHGSVSVSAGDGPGAVLAPGEQARFGAGGVTRPQAVPLDDALAWRGGRFTFYEARLADVVREIERYRNGRIVIASSDLADTRVTGSFPLSDTDAALSSLKSSVGFRMNRLTDRLVILGP